MPQPFPVARTVLRAFCLETGSGAGVADTGDGPDLIFPSPKMHGAPGPGPAFIAWLKESLDAFRVRLDDAARAEQRLSTRRLAFGLSPARAAGMSHIGEEIRAREAAAIGQRQAVRERGVGLSA